MGPALVPLLASWQDPVERGVGGGRERRGRRALCHNRMCG